MACLDLGVSESGSSLERGGGRSGQQLIVVVGRQLVSIRWVKCSGEEGCGNRDVSVSGTVQRNEGRWWERERVGGRVPVESHHFRGRELESNCAEEFIVRLVSKSEQLSVGVGFGLIDTGVCAGGSQRCGFCVGAPGCADDEGGNVGGKCDAAEWSALVGWIDP